MQDTQDGTQDGMDGGGSSRSGTGDARVDRIAARLAVLEGMPVAEHAEVYLDIHARLSSELNPGQGLRPAGAHGPS